MTRALVLSLVLLCGCEKIQEKLAQRAAEKAVEGAGGGQVSTDGGTTTVTDKKTGTVVQGGASVALPAGWPASVPVYPGAAVRNAMTTAGGKSATLVTKDAPAAVATFYKTKTSLKLQSDMDLGSQHMLVFANGKSNVTISISQSAGETIVTLMVTD